MQRAVWLHEQLAPGTLGNHLATGIELIGPLDVECFRAALQRCTDLHPAMRTAVMSDGVTPYRIVSEDFELDYELIDAEDWSEAEVERRWLELMSKPMDIASGGCFRFRLFRRSPDLHVLALTMHHVVSDGWSAAVAADTVFSYYLAERTGVEAKRRQPGDYERVVAAKQELLLGERGDVLRKFWDSEFANPPGPVELPLDRSRTVTPSYHGGVVTKVLEADQRARLAELAGSLGVSLHDLVLSAFVALLHRYSDQTDLMVGIPRAGRSLKTVRMIGNFVNPIVLRAHPEPGKTFAQLVEEVVETGRAIESHDDYPFEQIARLQPGRSDGSAHPFLRTVFVWQKAAGRLLTNRAMAAQMVQLGGVSDEIGDIQVRSRQWPVNIVNQELRLLGVELDDQLVLAIDYARDLFDAETIDLVVERLLSLLDQVAAAPDTRLADIELENPHQQPVTSVVGESLTLPTQLVHNLVEQQTTLTPHSIAVRDHTRSLTYDELDRSGEELANRLWDAGVRPEDVVGICLDRSVDMVSAMLAVMKVGAAYLPLDPELPSSRLSFMLGDAGVKIVITEQATEASLPTSVNQLRTDDTLGGVALDRRPTDHSPSADDLLYVMYTSGSTGTPKGVRISHRNMVNLLLSFKHQLEFGTDDVLLAVTTLSFDISGLELLLPLVSGAQVVVASADAAADGASLAKRLAVGDITVMQATPSTWQMLMTAGWQGAPGLRVLCGGEPLARDLADRLLGLVGEVWNVYGPTETTVWSSIGRVEDDGAVHIGRPIANTSFSIVDQQGRLLPPGIPGHLLIGGDGVALGYHNRPELTAERFVDDDDRSTSRYLTGDRAVQRLDGNFVCLGRLDDQVKVRGHRIELGEVEVALRNLAGVADAVAARDESNPASARLVAFVVAEHGHQLDPNMLRQDVSSSLPAYAVPSALGLIEAVPRTPNGKVDRRALDLSALASRRVSAFHPPTTNTEQALVDIWQEVLDQDRIGIDDDFFELGGHSLLATQIASRLHAQLSVDVPVRAIFEQPSVRALAVLVDGSVRAENRPEIQTVDRDQPIRLSISQERMWFLHHFDPEGSAYNIVGGLKITGPLDLAALEVALNRVVARHESLRTTFPEIDGDIVQIIHDAVPVAIDRVDWRRTPIGERPAAIDSAVAHEARRPFRLDEFPLLRVSCHRTGDDRHLLILNVHHIVMDQWSLGLLAGEIATFYRDELTGLGDLPPDLDVQYADYGAWQRDWLEAGALDHQLEYWRQRLDNVATLDLPTDRPRPAVLSSKGAVLSGDLSSDLVAGVHDLARSHQVSPYMVYLAAYMALVHRYSGTADIAVGTPVANRNTLDSERLIASMVNTLVLRAEVDGRKSFSELLQLVQSAALEAYEHQDMPFDRLVAELRPERDSSRSPLFQTFFNLQNAPFASPELVGTEVEVVTVDRGATQFELSLTIDEGLSGQARIEYSTDLYDQPRIQQMLGHYWLLVAGVVANPDRPIHSVSLLDEPVSASGANRHMAFDDHARVNELFEAQVVRTPDRIAARYRNEHLTYRRLDELANQLANALVRTGVGPDALVGIKLERSLEMLVAVLAVQKAGAAYLPLDPAFPADRLNYMLDDSGADVVVSRSDLVEDLAATRLVLLDRDAADIAAGETSRPDTTATSSDRMYVIYTSGSTGLPKGVELEHRSVVNFLTSMAHKPGITAEDRLVAVTTLSFDIAVLELYLPLLNGAEVVIAPTTAAGDGEALAELMEATGATILQATPTTWRLLIESGWQGRQDLVALCGGEALPRDLADELPPRCSSLWNMYGPTETTVWSSVWRVTPQQPILIGEPIGNTTFHVVDAYGNIQPPGVPGELLIGGDGVARGYLNRPQLTAEKFVEANDQRLYRTGDLAVARPDGNFECLGRIDSQVKVRGFRIELGEIESALAKHPSVKEAVVATYEHRPGDVRLAAYVIPTDEAAVGADGFEDDAGERSIDGAALAAHLGQTLPDYMVPSNYTRIDSVPLTPNRKLDRARLPAPDLGSRLDAAERVAPSTVTEHSVHDIWSRVLGTDEFGVDDNFFDLGGHSLLATQVASRVRAELGCELGIRDYFEAQTIADISRLIDETTPGSTVEAVEIVPIDRTKPIPLSFAQERMWFLHRLNPDRTTYNLDASLRLRGRLDVEALQWSLDRVVERHESLRTSFVEDHGTPRQQIADSTRVVINVVDLGAESDSFDSSDHRVREAIADVNSEPFDLEKAPLLRATLFRLGPDDHVLSYSIHHIVGDQWSSGILNREVAGFYNARTGGFEFDPEPLAVQYADYAAWYRHYLEGGALDDQLGYWRTQLDALPTLDLPTDHRRPAEQTDVGASIAMEVPSDLATAVEQLARRTRTSPFMVYLAGFSALLHRYTASTDIAIGTPIANRNFVESEALVSMFVNTLVLRADLSGTPTFGDLLARTQATALDGFANQDVPFERLVSELGTERDLSRSPLFQAFFNVQNAPALPVNLHGVEAEVISIEQVRTPFDLSMTLRLAGDGPPHASLEYRTDLFERGRMARLLDHYWTLLRNAIGDTDRPIDQVEILPADQLSELRQSWSSGDAPYQDGALLHDLVAEQARRTPENPAVRSEDGSTLTYRQLDDQANRLARHLLSIEVRTGDVVAIALPRSTDSAVAMLAVNRSGAAFVPLDPTFPSDRLRFVLEDSSAGVLITDSELESRCGAAASVTVCLLDDDAERLRAYDSTDPAVAMHSSDLAWIMYTSGSTGVPKGIEIEHHGAVNLFEAMAVEPGMAKDDVVMSVTTPSFDPSIQDVYLPLLHGATVVIASRETASDGKALANIIDRFAATQMFATPNTWRMLIEAGWQGSARFAAQSGGEPLPRDLADQLLARCSSVWNLYGLTEVTIWSSAYRVLAGVDQIPVGPPIKNTAFYILDANTNPVPLGVPGELYIGGVGVGRRFRGRPELDAERLVDDPFSSRRNARMYRTGDLARSRSDGTLEFLGRADDQVKVRGHRIELAEVETALLARPDVSQAAVTAREFGPGDVRLLAYVVPTTGTQLSVGQLREHLRAALPAFMVPSSYTVLDHLPLTSTQKVDRSALPRPDSIDVHEIWEPPTDGLEELLAGIWEDCLNVKPIGRNQNFFDLGGHSLLAVRMFARIEEMTGQAHPLTSLFRGPTVAQLAEVMRSESWASSFSSLVEVQPNGSKRPFFSVSPFLITTLSYQLLARYLGSDQPVYAFQPQGVERDDPIHQRVEDMAGHYIAEMKAVQPEGPYLLGGHCAGNWVAFEMATQLQAAGDEIALLVLIDSEPPNIEGPGSESPLQSAATEVVARLRHYQRDGRLKEAVQWQLGLIRQRFLLRWTGGVGQRRIAAVRAAHRQAHSSFRADRFDGDVLFIRSQESVDLRHKDWHLRWGELISGNVRVAAVPGTHASLMLTDDSTEVMAQHIADAINEASRA